MSEREMQGKVIKYNPIDAAGGLNRIFGWAVNKVDEGKEARLIFERPDGTMVVADFWQLEQDRRKRAGS